MLNLLGGLISDEQKENAIADYIKGALEDIAEEYGLKANELFFMIQPVSHEFQFKIYAYKIAKNGNEKLREISLKEILGADEH